MDFAEGTQFINVNVDRRIRASNRLSRKPDAASAPKTFLEKTIEEYSSQHYPENRNSDFVISPTLTKKINETSSESRKDLELERGTKDQELGTGVEFVKPTEPEDIYEPVIPDLEVIECVNFILDRICKEFAQYSEVLDDIESTDNRTNVGESIKQGKFHLKTLKANKTKATNGIKLKFTFSRIARSEDINKTENDTTEKKHDMTEKKIPPSIMDRTSDDDITTDKVQESFSNITIYKRDEKMNSRLLRRKRKLYSPKDKCHENRVNDEEVTTRITTEVKSYKQKKPNNYCKQVEEKRKEYIKKLRNRKLETKEMAMTPKTKRLNNVFDDLKNGIEYDEGVILADKSYSKDIAIYNFTSDSEDDFKETVKRRSKVKAKDKQKKKKVQSKRKLTRSNNKTKINSLSDNLEDERMRVVTVDVLNTSLHQKTSHESKIIEEPLIIEHTMEPMEKITIPKKNLERKEIKRKHSKAEETLSLEEIVKTNPVLNDTMNRTETPLPRLLLEATVPEKNITNDTVTENMMLKFKEIYKTKSVYVSERDSTRNLMQIECSILSKAPNITDECNNTSKDYLNVSISSSSKGKYTPVPKQKGKSKKSTETVKDEIENSNRSVFKEKFETGLANKANGRNKKGTSHLTKEERSNPTRVLKEPNEVEMFNNRILNRRENRSTSFCNKRDPDGYEGITILGEYSEKSFDTVGNSPITAHGGFDMCENDVSPSISSLEKNLEPRNLEVEDLDQSIQDFFTELNKEIAEITFDVRPQKLDDTSSSDSDSVEAKTSVGSKYRKDKSGINEEQNIEKHSTKSKFGQSKLNDLTNLEEFVSNKCSVAKIRSPVVSVARLSSDDINKWLQSPTEKSDRNEIDRKGQSDIKRITNRPKGKKDRKEKKEDMCKTAKLTSSISPIKLFADLKFSNRRDSVSSKYSNTESGDFERNLFHTNRTSSPIVSFRNTKIDCREGKSSYNSGIEASRSFASHIYMTSAHGSRSESKRRKIEDFESQRKDSSPSVSSVNDWFNRMAPTASQAEANSDSFKDHRA